MRLHVSKSINGYSTQASISLRVASIVNNGRIDVWFATEFNAVDNDDRSNPLQIFAELDRAANVRDYDARKVLAITDSLKAWVQLWEQKGLTDRLSQGLALQAIKTAFDEDGFKPRVMYLDAVEGAEKKEQPDEYRVENELIEGRKLRQILPPGSHGSQVGSPGSSTTL